MCIIAVTKKKGGSSYEIWKQTTRIKVYVCLMGTVKLFARTFKEKRRTWIYASGQRV